MPRYIDADQLKTIKSIQSANFNSIETIREWIDAQPTADVVKVVRCKDCVLRWTACPMVVRFIDANGLRLSFFTTDEDYCSRGKK